MSEAATDPATPAVAWNRDRTLSPFENLMWRAECKPMLRSTGVVVELLDHPPDHARLVAAHEWGTRLLAPLRHRVVEDPLAVSAPRWVVDQDFDLAYHLRVARLSEPGGIEQALAFAQGIAMAPFDRARPLWEAVLLEGFADGRAAYLLKLHHSITDGQGMVQMLDILHGRGAEAGRAGSLPVPAPENITGTGLAITGVIGAPQRLFGGALKGAGRLLAGAEQLVTHPGSALDVARYVQSLGRMLGPPPASGSVLLAQRNLNRRYGMLEVPLSQLRAAGRAAGGTVNDAFLAGLVGGMRRYHAHHGVDLEALTVAFPISLRSGDDPLGSNRFAGARILAPVAESDPAERIRIIGARTRAAREEPAIAFMDAIAPVLSRLPAILAATMTERVTRSIDLQASNIRGLDRPAYLAGARVQRTFAFGAAPGPAVMVTMMSYEGICCIALTINAAAVPDHEILLECIHDGLTEVVALKTPEPAVTVLGAAG